MRTALRPASPAALSARILAAATVAAGTLLTAAPAYAAEVVEVSTPYPAVAVEPGSTASFTLSVRADTRERVDLALSEVPEGWEATLRGGGFVVDGVFADPAEPPEVTLDSTCNGSPTKPDSCSLGATTPQA